LKKEDIEKMQKEAELHSEEDKKKKENVELKNIAEQMIYTAEKAIKDNGGKIDATIVKGVEDKIADLKKAKDGTDTDAIKKASEGLSTEMQKIGEAMQKAAQSAPGQTGATEEKKDDNVKDAEFKEKGNDGK
ncbi:MAG: Hsp70 family protein, partial [Candidatus Taylorbacteria bacterium]|nr:Hsp70 family protein [Candidatus Taylorbacteria bacterium]